MGDESAGAEAITLGNVVNPSLFWASYPLGANREATNWKFTIDEELKKHFSERRNRRSAFADDLKLNTRVVIEDPESQTWLRGQIEDRKTDGQKQVFDVFLIDIGSSVTGLDAEQIYLMPEKCSKLPSQAFLIALHGIEPLDLDVDLVVQNTVLEPSHCWSPHHFTFIQNFIAGASGALFKTLEVVNKVKHGVLYLDIDPERQNVNQTLVNRRHALQNSSVIDINKYLTRNKNYNLVKQFIGSSSKMKETNPENALHGRKGKRLPNLSGSKADRVKPIYSDEGAGVDVDEEVESVSSCSTVRKSGGRPSAPIYPAGFTIPALKKGAATPKSVEQEDFRRRSCETRSGSMQSTTSSRSSTKQEAWSDDDSKVEFRVKSDHQVTKENASSCESTVSCNEKEALGNTKTGLRKNSDNKSNPGLLTNIWNLWNRTNDDVTDSDSDSDLSATAVEKSKILSLYYKSGDKNLAASKDTAQSSSVGAFTSPNSESCSDAKGNLSKMEMENNRNLSNGRPLNPSTPRSVTVEDGSSPARNTSELSIQTSTPVQTSTPAHNVSTPTQNVSDLSPATINNSTSIQNVSCTSSTSKGGKSRLQREIERSEEYRRRSGNSTMERSALSGAGSNKKALQDNFSDSSSQSSVSQRDFNNSESHCDLSITSRSSQRDFGSSSLTDSMSETEGRTGTGGDEFEDSSIARKERVLAHDSTGEEVYPVDSLKDFDIDDYVKSALGLLRVISLSRLQLYACPLIHNWRDVAMVAKAGDKKSVSFVIPLLSLLYRNIGYRQRMQTNCPKVVIVCPWSSACENIRNCIRRLLSFFQNEIKVVTAYSSGKQVEKDKLVTLANGCDVLITTPRYLVYLFNQVNVINLCHIHHFVLDGCHDLFKYFEPEVSSICQKISALKAEKRKVQIVVTSEVYNKAMDQLVRGFMYEPVVLIADAKETAIYGKCVCKFTITTPDNKIKTLLSMLDEFKASEVRTLIVCNEESIELLSEILQEKNYKTEVVNDMTIFDENVAMSRRSHLRSQLDGVHPPVVLSTDDDLSALSMHNFHVLIHYDLPPGISVFSARYFSIFANIPNRLVKNCKHNYCKTGVILDTDNNMQFPALLDYIKRFLHKVEIPPEAEEIAKTINHEKEEEKRDRPLCSRLLKFGECWPATCSSRHVFINETDFPQFIPRKGFVKVKILHLLDASNFSARLLECSDDSVNWIHHTDNYGVFAAKLNMHFMDPNNRYTKANPVQGDIVIFEYTPNDFKRASILELAPKKRGKPQDFKIKLIDEGLIHADWIPESLLLTCPERFQEDIPFAIDVFVCGLKPVDLDHTWNHYACKHIWREISKYHKQEADGYFFTGKIKLALNSRLWLDPFECQQFLDSTKVYKLEFSIKQELLDKSYAVKNPEHLPKLFELCRRVDLPIPLYETQKISKPVKKVETVKPQWAHLPLDEENRSQSSIENVYITHNNDPDMVFIQQTKFLDRLEELHRDINKKMSTHEKVKKKDWKVDDLCLANYTEQGPNTWYRAQIISRPSNDEVGVFYVDYGQEVVLNLDQITTIEPEFITRLPFQAIECGLAAVRPLANDTWDDGAAYLIDDFMMDEDRINKTIQAKAIQIESKARNTGGRRYLVVLRDISDNAYTIINKALIDHGYARMWRSQALYLDPSLTFKEVDSIPQDTEEEYDLWESEDAGGPNFPDEAVQDLALLQNYDFDKFAERFLENFTEEDEEPFKLFAVEVISKTLNRDPTSFEFEKITSTAPFSSPRIKELPNDQSIDDGTDTDLCTLVVEGEKCPQVLWHQNSTHLFLRVNLIGVGEYYLECNDNSLGFNTNLKNQLYKFEVTLLGVIDTTQIEHSAKGFYVDIKLKKKLNGMWPRLTLETYKLPWLKFNQDYCEDDEEAPHKVISNQESDAPMKAVPDGLWEETHKETSLQEEEAGYNMPIDPYDPGS